MIGGCFNFPFQLVLFRFYLFAEACGFEVSFAEVVNLKPFEYDMFYLGNVYKFVKPFYKQDLDVFSRQLYFAADIFLDIFQVCHQAEKSEGGVGKDLFDVGAIDNDADICGMVDDFERFHCPHTVRIFYYITSGMWLEINELD